MTDDGDDAAFLAGTGGALLAAAAAYALTLQGRSVPCRELPACRRAVVFDAGQVAGLVVVGAVALAYAALVAREGWSRRAMQVAAVLATVGAAVLVFVTRGVLGTGLLPLFRPVLAVALGAVVLLALAAVRGRNAAEAGPLR